MVEGFLVDFRCCSHPFIGLHLYILMYKEKSLLWLNSFARFDAKVEKVKHICIQKIHV